MRCYNPSQVLTAKHVLYPQLTATLPLNKHYHVLMELLLPKFHILISLLRSIFTPILCAPGCFHRYALGSLKPLTEVCQFHCPKSRTGWNFYLFYDTERKEWSRNGSTVEPFSCPQDGPLLRTVLVPLIVLLVRKWHRFLPKNVDYGSTS